MMNAEVIPLQKPSTLIFSVQKANNSQPPAQQQQYYKEEDDTNMILDGNTSFTNMMMLSEAIKIKEDEKEESAPKTETSQEVK